MVLDKVDIKKYAVVIENGKGKRYIERGGNVFMVERNYVKGSR